MDNVLYNKMMYTNGPTKYEDFVSDKYEHVHQMMFNYALKKYFEDNKPNDEDDNYDYSQFIKDYEIVELRNKEYHLPSKVIIKSRKFPYHYFNNEKSIDLTNYWSDYEFNEYNKDKSNLLIGDETIKDSELVYIDYVRNIARFRNRIDGKEFETTLDYLNKDVAVNKDEMTLYNTFLELMKNI